MARMHNFSARTIDLKRDDANRQTTALAGMAAALAIVVLAFFLIRHLHATSAIEDCLMAARQNCDILVAANH